ncbi:MAG: phage tail tube protein [Pseudomonadota bacterium]
MSSQRGRDLLLKIGDGADPEVFTTIGAARTVSMSLNNQTVDNTAMDGSGFQSLQAEAGVQTMELTLEGLFRDASAEEALRLSAFDRAARNYQLLFPNGDLYAAAFVIHEYRRGGSFDGLETFAVALARTGGGAFTPGA